ncbi:MAG: flagellar biosynthesis protein FlhB [Magnetococcales bacterium]|nr:flagellar biosynthesis protein FlhB [Magnetococcales bacterium]
MAEDTDKDSKTEEPTGKRLGDARNKGQVATSREVGTAFLFLAATGLFYFQGRSLWNALQEKLRFFLGGAISNELTEYGVVLLLQDLVKAVVLDLAPFFIVFVVMALMGSILQNGFMISFEALKPKFSKLNPITGFKRLFSMRSLVELLKSIMKMTVISLAVWYALKDSSDKILGLAATSLEDMITFMADDIIQVMWLVTLAFIFLALIDFIYQKFEYIKGLRMSKQEVKDEQKQMEGDPLIKGRIRQIQREMAQRRMMDEVPQADVVLTNPTHYSVALRYTAGEMSAPKVVAKGTGHIALRIRELAKENGVPLVENPPLARNLYQGVDLDQAIPAEYFKAVAEVLAYVFSLKRAGQAHAR